jgi:hypothetical protein
MKEEGLIIVAGIVAVGIVGYLVLTGSQGSSSGVAFGQANPQSVAALYSAQAADTAQGTALQTAQSSDEAGIAQTILGNLATFSNNATALGTNAQNTQSAAQIANTNASASEYSAAQAASSQNAGYQAATAQQSILSDAAKYIATNTNSASVNEAVVNAGAQTQVAVAQSNQAIGVAQQAQIASTNVAASQTTAAVNQADIAGNAAKDASNSNIFGSIISGVSGILGLLTTNKAPAPMTPTSAAAPAAVLA